jgi:tetratricopeptide (TPR) repeat protein
VLGAEAYHHALAGRFDDAIAVARAALRDGIPKDSPWPGLATNVLSFVDLMRGDTEAAAERLQAVLASPDGALLDVGEQVTYLAMAGGITAGAGDFERARMPTQRALDLARQSGNPSALCSSLYSDAVATHVLDPDRAIAQLQESISLTREGATPVVFGYASTALSVIFAARGDHHEALTALRDAVAFVQSIGDRAQLLNASGSGVVVLTSLGLLEPTPIIAGYLMNVMSPVGVSSFPKPGSHEESVLAALTRVEDALGSETFSREFERGQSMSYDEFVDFYLGVLDAAVGDHQAERSPTAQ